MRHHTALSRYGLAVSGHDGAAGGDDEVLDLGVRLGCPLPAGVVWPGEDCYTEPNITGVLTLRVCFEHIGDGGRASHCWLIPNRINLFKRNPL